MGVKDTVNLVPSDPKGSKIPVFGAIANPASDSAVNLALKFLRALFLLVNLNYIEVVLCNGELIIIISSSKGGVDSRFNLYFHKPPIYLFIIKSTLYLNGFKGINLTLNNKVSSGLFK